MDGGFLKNFIVATKVVDGRIQRLSGSIARTAIDKLSETISVKDFGAKGDGTTDDAFAIQFALNEAAGKTLVFPPGSYLVNSSLVSPSNIEIRGYRAKLLAGEPSLILPTLDVYGQSNVVIAGLEIDGRKGSFADTQYKHCIRIVNSSQVTLRDLYLHDAKGDGLYVGGADGTQHCSDVFASNVRCDANYRQGLSISDLDNGAFVGCKFSNTAGTAPQAGVDVEPNAAGNVINNITFVGCDMTGNAGAGIQVVLSASPTATQEGVRIVSSRIKSNGASGVLLQRARRTSITDSDIASNATSGVEIKVGSDGTKITGGRIRSNGVHGIFCFASSGTDTITGLKIIGVELHNNSTGSSNSRDGIRIDWSAGAINGCTEVLVSGCTSGNVDGATTQRYGITTGSNVRRLKLLGNDFNGNATGASVLGDDYATRLCKANAGVNDIDQSVVATPTYGASISINSASARIHKIIATNGNAFAIGAPAVAQNGQTLVIDIRNASGGALGAISWNGVYRLESFTAPANGKGKTIEFYYDGTNWVQKGPASGDF